MTPVIELRPAPRSNPEGRDDLPWNIFRDTRCTNTAPNRQAAKEAGERLRVKVGGIWKEQQVKAVEEALGDTTPSYLKVARPRGSPDLGTMIEETWPFDQNVKIKGRVVMYLSEQFVYETDDGQRRIVHVKGDWKVAE